MVELIEQASSKSLQNDHSFLEHYAFADYAERLRSVVVRLNFLGYLLGISWPFVQDVPFYLLTDLVLFRGILEKETGTASTTVFKMLTISSSSDTEVML